MLVLAALFLVGSGILFATARGLSSPQAGFPRSVRIGLGAVVVLSVVLATLWFDCSRLSLLAIVAAVAVGSAGLHGDGTARLGGSLGRSRFLLYLLSVTTLSGLTYLVVPIITFLTSPGELEIHLDYLLAVNVRDAMVIVYVAAAFYAVLPSPRMKTAITLLAMGALGLTILYAFVLPFGYPMMTGLVFEQIPLRASVRLLRLLVDLLIVGTLAVTLRWTLLRFTAKPFVIGLLLANVSLGAAVGIGASREKIGGAGGSGQEDTMAAQPLRLAPNKPNVLVIVLDRLMGGYVEPILEAEPGLVNRLSGFVWYPRTVSAGQNSISGMHPILGGYDYLPVEMNARHEALLDLSTEAFSILPYNFSRRGYRVNVVNPGGLGFTTAGDCSYLAMDGVTCSHISPAFVKRRAETMGFPIRKISESSYADLLVLLASMRVAPYLLKEVILERGPWRQFLDHSAGTTFRVWAELESFPELTFTGAEQPNLNIVFNILPHEPYFLDEDCRPLEERFALPLAEVRRRGHPSVFSLQHANAARCALLMTANYLDFLKTAGVYANTKIVIVSDHGIVGDVEDHSSRAVAGGTQANAYVRTRSVLFVKEIGAEGALRVSEEFVPNAEVPRIVCEEIGGCINPYLDNRPIAALGRDDPFYVSLVPWQFSLQQQDAFVVKRQLALRGKDPYDSQGWVEVD